MIKNLEDWLSSMRDVSLLPDAPIAQKDGKWAISHRKEAWKALGPRVFDEYLDRFKNIAIEVLGERHPQFELNPDERFAASARGKVLKHSVSLRKGVAETLALLGTSPECLTSCSHGKPEVTPVLVIREIFKNADWILWASLNDYLPALAEAAPSEFLTTVEEAIEKSPCLFTQLFGQSRGGIMGQNHTTGLLWALEILAWSPEHLQRVTVLLGELAAIDPGGNWVNRPANSLTEIFLPWMPHTCAPLPKRKTAVAALLKEHPAVGWKLLLSLMPDTHSSSLGTRKPVWRNFIPEGWSDKVTNQEYWEQVNCYGEIAVTESVKDFSKLSKLIDGLPHLPEPVYSKIIEHLGSSQVVASPQSSRLPLWEALVNLAQKHRKFPDAHWAMPPEAIAQIETIASQLAPKSPQLLHHRLFSVPDFELFEETGNFEDQQKELKLRRESAVREILDEGQLEGLLDFARQVTNPGMVGLALGNIDWDSVDSVLLPASLNTDDKVLRDFVGNFIWGRFWTKSWDWVDAAFKAEWTIEQKAAFFIFLPFTHDTWRRAETILGNHASAYWKTVTPMPFGPQPHLLEAVEKLLEHERPQAGLRCLERLVYDKVDFPPGIAVRALLDNLKTTNPLSGLDQHTLLGMIEWLQNNPDTSLSALYQVEWAYLPLFDYYHSARPKSLERRLATEPEFFCEVIAVAFRSNKEADKQRQLSEAEQNLAGNAYRLLHGWQTAPGRTPDGGFDGGAFTAWVEEVNRWTKESGHFEIAQSQIGEVLPYAPENPDGLWIHVSVAEALNKKEAGEMRSGFTCELFNKRGVHGFTSGNEERELAEAYYKKAEALEERSYHRIATAIRELAKSYERDADREGKRNSFKE